MSYNQIEENKKDIQEYKDEYGLTHSYSQTEWIEWDFHGCYIKSHYDVMLPDGRILKHQWPNAGKIAGYSGGVKVKLSDTHPFDKSGD